MCKAFAAALVAGVMIAPAAHASLLGDTIHGVYYFPDLSTVYQDGGNKTVSPSATFLFSTGVPNTTATVTADQITFSFNTTGTFTTGSFNGLVITDLTNSNITGATIDTSTTLVGVSAADVSFTSNSVSVNIQSRFVPSSSTRLVIDVATAVPEPATLTLLCAGLLGAGLLRSRRKQ